MITFYKVGDKFLEINSDDLVFRLLELVGKTKTGEIIEVTEKDIQNIDQIISEATSKVNRIRQQLDPETKKFYCFVSMASKEEEPASE